MRGQDEPLTCSACGGEIGTREAVYRVRIKVEGVVEIASRCGGCLDDALPPSPHHPRFWKVNRVVRAAGPDAASMRLRNRSGEPCESCGRPVVLALDGRLVGARVACDARCRREIDLDRRRRRRAEGRATLRDGKRRCETCGRRYEPSRSDQSYCSPKCRQKAYRERKREA